MRLLPFTALLCALFLLMVACAPAHRKTTPDAGLELRLLHVNDTHAFLAGIDEHMNACFEAADCRGGLARISAAIQTARQEQDNVIALDAGDQFQGTLFYSVNKWPVIAAVDALLPYDAMTLGNHEFDEGCRELARFLEAQPLPVLAANLTPQQGCPLAGSRIRPYLVRTVRGTRVGIIGLANDEVTGLAAACPRTTFRDARTTLQQYVAELEAQGIRHIIVVTHLGLERDRELARSVNGVDVIVGGHTHTYLGPGSKDGPYPIVEHAPDGAPVLVVTAARATRLLERWSSVHGIRHCPLDDMALLGKVLDLRKERYISGSRISRLAEEAGAPDIERKVLFLQELLNTTRSFAPSLFDGNEGRMKVLDAVQDAVDAAIAEEDAWLAEQG